jgi:hypothetical protein
MDLLKNYTQEEINKFALRYLKLKISTDLYINKYRKTEKGKRAVRKAAYYRYWRSKGKEPPLTYEKMREKHGRKI